MPGIVDPRPYQEQQLRQLQAELDAATDDATKERLQTEITDLEHQMGRHGGWVRRFLLGFGHRAAPW